MASSLLNKDTIVALASPHGTGAIALIRLSGPDAIAIADAVCTDKGLKAKKLSAKPSHTIHLACINDDDVILDEALISLFKAPHSYTGEDIVEISCHGSLFIQQQVLQLLLKKGARLANAGEFTLRGFLNGKFDLSQAEAVADLIASSSATSHQVAMQQMRGGFSDKIKVLRENLVNFASLIELELDFSEEDVEFADRNDLKNLVISIQRIIDRLVESFEIGNVIKHGIPVAIVGKPNAGKSTLLNAILDDDRAIVSEIPGTTRDTIEEELNIDGVLFRFVDTAGIRDATDLIESIGVAKTFEKMKQSSIVIYLFDVHEMTPQELNMHLAEIRMHLSDAKLILAGNKIDKEDKESIQREFFAFDNVIFLSAKEKYNLDALRKRLVELFDNSTSSVTETIVTNVRHVEALRNAQRSLHKVLEGLNHNITGELLAVDIRQSLHHLGEITGEVTTDDLLENIFSKFCIGK